MRLYYTLLVSLFIWSRPFSDENSTFFHLSCFSACFLYDLTPLFVYCEVCNRRFSIGHSLDVTLSRSPLTPASAAPLTGAYYAAQQGIALKLKDSAARHFLFDLLGLLERMKTDLGANDAVHDELASAAYIENFGLRVFANADTEDRKGNSTRCVF